MREEFEKAIKRYEQMRRRQEEEKNRLRVVEIKSGEHTRGENKIMLRIAKEKGIDVMKLIGDEYSQLKDMVNEERRQKFMEELDNNFFAE